MGNTKESQLGQLKVQDCTEVKLHNTDELVSRITALTKDSCNPAALANARPEANAGNDQPLSKEAMEAKQLEHYRRSYLAVTAKIPNSKKKATEQYTAVSYIKHFVKKHFAWVKKIKNGSFVTVIRPKGEIIRRVFASAESTGEIYNSSLVIVDPVKGNVIITANEVSKVWAGIVLIESFSILREKLHDENHPGVGQFPNYDSEAWGHIFAHNAANALTNNEYRRAVRQIITESDIYEPEDVIEQHKDKYKHREIAEQLDKVFGDEKYLSTQEQVHRETFYFRSVLYEFIEQNTPTEHNAIKQFNEYYKLNN